MYSLSLPIPVAQFLRRLFNVISSLTISNQYFLLQKTDLEAGRENSARQDAPKQYCEKADARSEELTAEQRSEGAQHPSNNRDGTDAPSYADWSHLRPWRSPLRQPPPSQQTRSPPPNEENKSDASPSEQPSPSAPSTPPTNPRLPGTNSGELPMSPLHALMLNPTLFNPVRRPRFPIVLCHGLYGYDVRGPSSFPMLQIHYWSNVMKVVKKKIGAEVIVTGVPGTGSIESRAECMDSFLREKARGQDVNFIAHSMGGLDCRHLISHVKPRDYRPASLTTICTPHRGSPFMDWCTNNIGIGKLQDQAKRDGRDVPDVTNPLSAFSLASFPSSLTTLLLSVLDSPAYANLSTHYLENVFNPATPNDPCVRYYSVAARTANISVWHPLWLPKMVLDGVEARERETQKIAALVPPDGWGNDGLVSVRSAQWGEFLGTLEGCDHWDVRGARSGVGGDGEWHVDLSSVVRSSLSDPLSHLNANWREWGRLIGLWRKEEERRQENERELERKEGRIRASHVATRSESEDAVLKSSTDKLSAVFDWVAEQVPLKRSPGVSCVEKEADAERTKASKEREAKDPRLRFDLERFYIALSRKLYDDGL